MTTLKKEDKRQLREWLGRPKACFELLYQATKDGLNSQVFHAKCDGKGSTITVATNTAGYVFGGCNPSSWNSAGNYYVDYQAWLFRLKGQDGVTDPAKFAMGTNFANTLYGHQDHGPTFGGGHDMFFFSGNIAANEHGVFPSNGYSKIGHTYSGCGGGAQSFCGENYQYRELEVYLIRDLNPGEHVGDAEGRKEINKFWRKNRINWDEAYRDGLLQEVEKWKPVLDVKHAKILLTGFIGAGKSSFMNTVSSVFSNHITQKTAMGSSSHSVTKRLKGYEFVSAESGKKNCFKIYDTMGMEDGDSGLLMKDIGFLLDGHIDDKYKFNPVSPIDKSTPGFVPSPGLGDQIHCVAIIVDGSTVSVLPEKFISKFKDIQEEARSKDIPCVALVTKIDRVCEDVEGDLALTYYSPVLEEIVDSLAAKLGMTRNNVLVVKNYESEIDLDFKVDILALTALKQMLYFCNNCLEEKEDELLE